jgi:uncharacterized protein HemX
MKKLMALALGMALAMTTVVVAFGQDTPTTKKETTIKKKNKKGTTKTEKTEKKVDTTKS